MYATLAKVDVVAANSLHQSPFGVMRVNRWNQWLGLSRSNGLLEVNGTVAAPVAGPGPQISGSFIIWRAEPGTNSIAERAH